MTILDYYLDKDCRLISDYGQRKDPLKPSVVQFHYGIDVGMPLWYKNNSPYSYKIQTPFKGSIHAVGTYGDRGLTVVQRVAGTNLLAVFQHLAKSNVKVNQIVSPDDTIGIMGTTGRSTGIHLHFEFRTYSNAALGSGVWGDPKNFQIPQGGTDTMLKTAVLDPGHGGSGHLTKFGSSGNGLVEKNLVLAIAKFSRDHLLANYLCKVVMTRDSDVDVSFAERANIARNAQADILFSLHFNGFENPAANGFETFIYNGTLRQTTVNNQHIIHDEIFTYLNTLGIRNRGKKSANFAILRLPPTSCVLAEYCFLTNPTEATIMKRVGVIEQLGIRTAEGIAKALELPKKVTPPAPTPPAPTPDGKLLYRVVAGTYAQIENARTMKTRLESLGINSAFILPFIKEE